MALPAQVQAAEAAADSLLASLNDPPSSDDQNLQQSDGTPAPDTQQQAPQPPAAPEPQSASPDPAWEDRYNSLKGLFNQKVPALQQENKELKEEMEEVRRELKRLSDQAQSSQTPPAKPQVADAKDVDTFGADLVDMVSRVATAANAAALKPIIDRINQYGEVLRQMSQRLEGTTQQVAVSAEQRFFDALTKQVPNWEQLNTDQNFLKWLAQIDPVYGVPRQAALEQAQKALNAGHAAAVFKAYLDLTTKPESATKPLQQQVSPRSAASAAPPAPAEKKVIRQADIAKFYDDLRRGLYRGKEQLALQIEQSINTALSEGRVQ